MTTPTLSDQLRAIVDAVDTPTFADIRSHEARPHPRGPRTRVVLAFGAVLVIVALGAVVVALLREGGSTPPTSRPDQLHLQPDVVETLPPDCVITTEVGPGCEMGPKDASRYVGSEVREPSGMPTGWEPFAETLRVYQGPGAGLPQGVDSVALYVRAWGPPGSDFTTMGDCGVYVQVRQRLALPGEDPASTGATAIPLGNGTVAHGQPPTAGCGDATTGFGGEFAWVSGGRSFVVEGNGVTTDQLLAIARSLDR
jgi:hypothetical protein